MIMLHIYYWLFNGKLYCQKSIYMLRIKEGLKGNKEIYYLLPSDEKEVEDFERHQCWVKLVE